VVDFPSWVRLLCEQLYSVFAVARGFHLACPAAESLTEVVVLPVCDVGKRGERRGESRRRKEQRREQRREQRKLNSDRQQSDC